MNQNSHPIDTALAAALDDDSRSRSVDAASAGHPDLDAWTAYVEDRLSGAEHDRLQEHLVHCRECRELVLELDAFDRMDDRAMDDGTLTGSREDAAAEAARTDALVATVLERAGGPRATAAGHPAPPGATPWRLAAAVFLAGFLAAGFWGLTLGQRVSDLEERLAEATRPTGATVLLDLYPADTRWRSGGGEVDPDGDGDGDGTGIPRLASPDDGVSPGDGAAPPPGDGLVTWILHLPPGVTAGPWTVELVGPGDDILWRGENLTADPDFHTLLVGAPRAFLERRGRHALRLVPGSGGAAVAEYRFEVDGR